MGKINIFDSTSHYVYNIISIIILIIHRRGSPDAKISCVVSVGCGVYPPEPLGNTDIADALKMKNLHKLPSRLKELLNLLTTAVSPLSIEE